MKNKPTTIHDYQRRINIVIDYIRTHLDEDIDLRRLAEVSSFSPCHFHRIVSAFLGEPLGEFIARTRIETAARMLRYSELPISEIAWRIGYDAPSSLTKAFRRFFGISPSAYRTTKNLPPMSTLVQHDAGVRLSKPRILEIPEKTVAYIRAQGNYSKVDYGDYFMRLWQYVKRHKLFSAGIENIVIYHNDPDISRADDLRCDVCLVIPQGPVAEGEIGVKTIGAGQYAVFLYTGPYTGLGGAYHKICREWLPESGQELRDSPCFEKYINNPDRVPAEKLKTEIYIPIE
ncbi:GyrI-like domain-containing protein [uncultured Alistipes sp.]|jgi:transcriptional regulator, araC-type|uniref:AraC family transcriptional regulator n=1 Tax=uncultured Alistipes sp. TaxID=538949 RepID=UPI0025E53F1B|nr:AraC family transcriptional regulator [uncultured Alistipes sp.]